MALALQQTSRGDGAGAVSKASLATPSSSHITHDEPPKCISEFLHYDAMNGRFTWIKDPAASVDLAGQEAGYVDPQGYILIKFRGVNYRAHRLAWLFVHQEWPDLLIDHINGIKADNRIVNLRLATKQQNGRNRRNNRGKTLPKGVCFHKRVGRYYAGIAVNGRRQHLGYFDTPDEAANAYKCAAERLFGAFARFE